MGPTMLMQPNGVMVPYGGVNPAAGRGPADAAAAAAAAPGGGQVMYMMVPVMVPPTNGEPHPVSSGEGPVVTHVGDGQGRQPTVAVVGSSLSGSAPQTIGRSVATVSSVSTTSMSSSTLVASSSGWAQAGSLPPGTNQASWDAISSDATLDPAAASTVASTSTGRSSDPPPPLFDFPQRLHDAFFGA